MFKDLLSYTSLVYICFLLLQILFVIPIPMSIFKRIGEAMVGVLVSSAVDNGSSLDREKTNTIKLVCVASR